jgi:peptidoglycan/LPS O-acetylase OafA/YrhL
MTARTLGDQVQDGYTTGFDYLRIILAALVLAWHSFFVSYGQDFVPQAAQTFIAPFVRWIMPAFFALSGFLVTSSLERTGKLSIFLGLRFLRIFPALVVEVALSAFILGPLLTTLRLDQYFGNPIFFKYMLNLVGWIHYHLPGVFEYNPLPMTVNGSLWTVPFELECYIALAVLALAGIAKNRNFMLIAAVLATLAMAVLNVNESYAAVVNVNGRMLVLFFLAGVVVYKFRDKIPAHPVLAVASVPVSIALLTTPVGTALSSFIVAYSAAALGCMNVPKNRLLRSGDYSYGLYLYAFPVQQTVVWLIGGGHPLQVMALSLTGAFCFAVFSWHTIEKPTLRLKKLLTREARQPSTAAA